jgi:NAD(P)H-dependent flavin oxidoreductase YrpB (nitropropane dioxygenase family)
MAEVDPRLQTRATKLFGTKYPVVQTGMGWVANSRLTAATSNAGGLGILAAAPMTFEQMVAAIDEVRSWTDNPFGVNLRTDALDIDKRVEHIIKLKVPVASFAQAPGEKIVKTLKDAGIVVMPTIGARRHAEKVAAWGVDAVIAQGQEGGGHTGFVPTTILVPQVLDAVDIPVLAAGGIFDGRGLAGALAVGASGVAMGTRFLLTKDSAVADIAKEQYLKALVTDTVVTRAIDGAPQRVIRTAVIDRLERAKVLALPKAAANALRWRKMTGTTLRALLKEGLAMKKAQDLTWAQMAMAANAPMMTKSAIVDGHLEVGILPTGQGVGAIDDLPTCQELIDRMVAQTIVQLDRLCSPK